MKCKGCKQTFPKPSSSFVCWCSPDCGLKVWRAREARERAKQARAEAQELRKRKEAAKPRAQWMREAQTAFNAWIRARDAGQPCISCRREHTGQNHAGHYLSTGARPELRFNETNCHLQCQPCNVHLHGSLVLYRIMLIQKIGLYQVEWLEGPHTPKKYTIDELRIIRDDYRARLKVCPGAGVSGAVS